MKINVVKKQHRSVFSALSPQMFILMIGNRQLEVTF